ncbi:MAG TPA: hypothetical protein VFW40_11300 [Capsulimonadaceae bacterium]|nr:hypothetical protein [Capsulimonadaceae bacterium]
MKAHNPIYRAVLTVALWLVRSETGFQSVVAQLLFPGLIFVPLVAILFWPRLTLLFLPILAVVGVFFYLMLIGEPLFNLLLRLDPLGRMALSRRETLGANYAGLSLVLGIAGIVGYLATHRDGMMILGAFLAMPALIARTVQADDLEEFRAYLVMTILFTAFLLGMAIKFTIAPAHP